MVMGGCSQTSSRTLGRCAVGGRVAAASAVSNTATTESALALMPGESGPAFGPPEPTSLSASVLIRSAGNAELPEPSGDRGVLARVVQDDEIGPLGQHRLDARLDAVPQIGDGFGRGGVVAVAGAANHRGSAPMAKSSSVAAGMSDTTRRAGDGETKGIARVIDQLDASRASRGR